MFKRMKGEFTVTNASGTPLVHELKSGDKEYYKNIALAGLVVILGVLTGLFLSKTGGGRLAPGGDRTGGAEVAVGQSDSKVFKDSAEGDLESGGINGEGTHKLIRPGGDSQTVALTSSVLDMSQYEGKKVKVWGETFAGSTAGWFMDVGKIEVME